MSWKHFTDEEVRGLDTTLVSLLDYACDIAGVPFVITSGLRSPEENAALPGSARNSAHLRGRAVDLRARDDESRFRILEALFRVGFRRFEVVASDGHVHVDIDSSLPSPRFVLR